MNVHVRLQLHGCMCDMYSEVYTKDDTNPTWTLHSSYYEADQFISTTGEYYSVDGRSLSFFDGQQVAFMTGWSCENNAYIRTILNDIPNGSGTNPIGNHVGNVYSDDFLFGSMATLSEGTPNQAHPQSYSITILD